MTAAGPPGLSHGGWSPLGDALPPVPSLVVGHVAHSRPGPVRHGFRHRVHQWLVDLDDLPRQPWYLRPFVSFSPADHLGDPGLTIRQNVDCFLALNGVHLGPQGRVVMLANARCLGHVFDPLTVFWCLRRSGELACVLAEVHNTYAERHVYLLRPDDAGRARAEKELYVSPFNDVSGSYDLRFTVREDAVRVCVTLRRLGRPVFAASLTGRPVPAGRAAVVHQLLAQPFMPQRVSALIRVHGVLLWLRRLPVARRPHHIDQKGV